MDHYLREFSGILKIDHQKFINQRIELSSFRHGEIKWAGEESQMGRNGEVTFGYWYDKEVAVKCPFSADKNFAREVALHLLISSHPCCENVAVPQIFGLSENKLVMERVRGTPLALEDTITRVQLIGIVEYCRFLAFLGLQHGDLHENNIMVLKPRNLLAIIDYGCCSCCRKTQCERHANDIGSMKDLFDCQRFGDDRAFTSDMNQVKTILTESSKDQPLACFEAIYRILVPNGY